MDDAELTDTWRIEVLQNQDEARSDLNEALYQAEN